MKANQITGQLLDWKLTDDRILDSGAIVSIWVNDVLGEQVLLPKDMKPTLEAIYAQLVLKAPVERSVSVYEPELEDDTPVDRIATILQGSATGGRSEVKVYRIKEGGKEVFCSSYKPEDFENGDLSIIQKHFGGGNYRIRVYATDTETNKFVLRANQLIEIEQPIIDISPSGNGESGIAQLMLKMMDESNKRFEQLIALQQQNNQTEAKTLTQTLTEFKLMKEVFGGGEPKNSLSETLKTIQQIREFKDILIPESKNGDDDNSELLALGKQGLGLISQLAAPAPQPIQYQSPPIISPVKIPPNINNLPKVENIAESQKPKTENENDMIVQIFIKALVEKAKENADIQPIADDLINTLPEDVFVKLDQDDWFSQLCAISPECADHADWFKRLHDALYDDGEPELAQQHNLGLSLAHDQSKVPPVN
jgi:hypothetical protein